MSVHSVDIQYTGMGEWAALGAFAKLTLFGKTFCFFQETHSSSWRGRRFSDVKRYQQSLYSSWIVWESLLTLWTALQIGKSHQLIFKMGRRPARWYVHLRGSILEVNFDSSV